MVKLTPELINSCMQFINPCRDRELDMRGEVLWWIFVDFVFVYRRFIFSQVTKFPKFRISVPHSISSTQLTSPTMT